MLWLLMLLLLLLLLLLQVLVLVLMEMMPEPSPAKPPAWDSAPKSIRAAPPASYVRSTIVVPAVRTTARPPTVGLTFYLATPFPFTLSWRKALLARR
jgi:hypothetical protein